MFVFLQLLLEYQGIVNFLTISKDQIHHIFNTNLKIIMFIIMLILICTKYYVSSMKIIIITIDYYKNKRCK